MANGGWFCCCKGCEVASFVAFGGGLNDITGWLIVSGNWEPGPFGELTTDGANAKIVCLTPTPSEAQVARVTLWDETDGGEYFLILNYNRDNGNYHYVKFTRSATNPVAESTMTLGKVVGGEDIPLKSEVILGLADGLSRTIYGCLAPNGLFYGAISGSVLSYVVTTTSVITDGMLAGFGMNADPPGVFTDFSLQKHASDDPNCPDCICACQGREWPETLKIYMQATGRCSDVLTEGELTWDRMSAWWKGSLTFCGNTWNFILACSAIAVGEVPRFRIAIEDLNGCCSGDDLNPCAWNSLDATCTPIYALFQVLVRGTWLSCACCPPTIPPTDGYIDIWITE